MLATSAVAQTPPSLAEIARYNGLHAAAARGWHGGVPELIINGLDPNIRDQNDRTPLHVAAFHGHTETMRALVQGGADPNALDKQKYDIVTILAVKDDPRNLEVALQLGCDPRNVTSPWSGTALIAAAHLGHDEVVRILIKAGAPLDHVNSLHWTALIESIVLGDGGLRHTASLKALVDAGADVNLADAQGRTPLRLARERGYSEMVDILEKAGAR
ncbi:MAG: ankyrin repeat domain-containing protein [Beijerinckiaceae bacterium]